MKPPLIFAGPAIPKGETQALVYLLDLFPTVCDLVGTQIPDGLDGKSLKPVIEGKSPGVRDTLFLSYRDVQRAVRDSRYKLICYPHVNVTQLFDLQNDPDELTNLADRPDQAERAKSLTAEMQRWQRELGDTAPLTVERPQNPAWNPADRPATPPGKGKGKKQGQGG
jgi:arylsulfatase A-like enzyme